MMMVVMGWSVELVGYESIQLEIQFNRTGTKKEADDESIDRSHFFISSSPS